MQVPLLENFLQWTHSLFYGILSRSPQDIASVVLTLKFLSSSFISWQLWTLRRFRVCLNFLPSTCFLDVTSAPLLIFTRHAIPALWSQRQRARNTNQQGPGLQGCSADRGLTLNYKMKVTNRKVWSFQSIESLFLNLRWSFFFGILNRRPPKLKRPPSAFFAGYFPVFMPPLTYVKTSDPRDYILKILEFSILPSTSSKRRLSLTW